MYRIALGCGDRVRVRVREPGHLRTFASNPGHLAFLTGEGVLRLAASTGERVLRLALTGEAVDPVGGGPAVLPSEGGAVLSSEGVGLSGGGPALLPSEWQGGPAMLPSEGD